MQDFNTPKTGEGASPAESLLNVIAGYRVGMDKYLDVKFVSEEHKALERKRLREPCETMLAEWSVPAANKIEALAALKLLHSEIVDFEPSPLCTPMLNAALAYLEKPQPTERLDTNAAYCAVREGLGMVRLMQRALDSFLDEHPVGTEKGDMLRDIEQTGVIAGRALDRALVDIDELGGYRIAREEA